MMQWATLLTAFLIGQGDGTFRDGPVVLRIRPEPDRGVISLPAPDELTITIRVEGSDKLEVTPPSKWIASRPWHAHPPAPAKIEKVGAGRIAWLQTLQAYPPVPGEFDLTLAPIVWKDGDNQGQAKFAPIAIRSFSTIEKADLRNLRDPVWIESLPPEPRRRPWLNIALTGLGVSVGLFLALRGMRRRPKGPKHSPEERALRALDRIDGWRLPEQGKGERYFALLSLVVRRYLERKHQLPARHRTSRDLLDLLANRDDLVAEREFLAHFAEQADRAKFAATPSSSEECRAAQQSVRAWLQSRPL
ncbi:MAG: hypothetical protein K2X38_12630 [Gemmataceae bacterium]|nr:hypothetical protein [Gemmataceae bacterium]